MPELTIEVTGRQGQTSSPRTITGELVNGLLVHPDHNQPERWRIATRTGVTVDTLTQRGGWPLERDQAAAIADVLGKHIPEQVKTGQWTGPQWRERDDTTFHAYERCCRQVQLTLDGFGDQAAPFSAEAITHRLTR
jgi:hypothetical protein